MVIDQRCSIDTKPRQRHLICPNCNTTETLKVMSAFISDISRHMHPIGESFFNLTKQLWYFIEFARRYRSHHINEKQTPLIGFIKTRGLKQNRTGGSCNHGVQLLRKLSPMIQNLSTPTRKKRIAVNICDLFNLFGIKARDRRRETDISHLLTLRPVASIQSNFDQLAPTN